MHGDRQLSLEREVQSALSEPFEELIVARRGIRDAVRACGVAQERAADQPADATETSGHRPGKVVRFEDVDLVTWLIASRSPDALHEKTRQQLGELLERADLADTVVTHLACDLDVQATSSRLHLHPNSVRYRLRRIEEIVGGPLTSPGVLTNLYLALHDHVLEESARLGTREGDEEDPGGDAVS